MVPKDGSVGSAGKNDYFGTVVKERRKLACGANSYKGEYHWQMVARMDPLDKLCKKCAAITGLKE